MIKRQNSVIDNTKKNQESETPSNKKHQNKPDVSENLFSMREKKNTLIRKQSQQIPRSQLPQEKKQNIQIINENLNQDKKQKIEQLETELKDLLKKYKELSYQKQETENKLGLVIAQNSQNMDKILSIQQQSDSWKNKYSAERTENSIIKQFEKDNKQNFEKLESELTDLQQKNKVLSDIKQQYEQQQESFQVQKQQYENKLESFQKESDQWKNKSQQQEAEIQSIQKQLEDKNNQLNEKVKEINSLQIKNQTIQQQLEVKVNQLNEKEKEINRLKQEKEDAQLFLKKIEVQNLNSLQQIQDCFKILNPSSQIDNSQVEFIKNYSQILKNPLSEKEKNLLKNESDKLTNELINSSKKIVKDSDIKSPIQGSKGILLIKQLLEMQGIMTFITKLSMKELQQQNKGNIVQQEILGTGQIENNRYYSLSIDKKSTLYQNIQRAFQSEQDMAEFSNLTKKTIGNLLDFKSFDNNITLLRVQLQPAPFVDFKLNSQQIGNGNEEIKKKIVSFKDMGLSLSVQNLLQYAKISEDMFEPQFNMKWDDSFKGKFESRGSLQFYNQQQPTPQLYNFPVGYHGLALKVLDKYGQDKSWLNSDDKPSTWICLYHGTSDKYLESIMKSHLKGGPRNYYGGYVCRITNKKITTNPTVYLSDQVTVAQEYCLPDSIFDGKQYYIIFQCRVNPKGVRSPQAQPDYYTVEDPANDIRPYRILYKEKI